MRNNQKAKKLAMRVSAMGLALVMVISLIGTLSISASAVVSLRGIEMLKKTGELSILEIVPQSGSGSIGYYVGGQEPSSDWYNQVATISGAQNRANYANTLFGKLQNAQLMNNPNTDAGMNAETVAATYPLTYKGQYQEFKPWDNVDRNTLVPLKLLQAEEQTVTGKIDPCQNGEKGDYAENNTYTCVCKSSSGTAPEYIENVAYYEYFGAEGAHYYHVDFQQVFLYENQSELKNAEIAPNATVICIPNELVDDNSKIQLYTKDTLNGLPYYNYEGTLTTKGTFKPNVGINKECGYYIAIPDYTTISEKHEPVVKVDIEKLIVNGDLTTDRKATRDLTFYVVDDVVDDTAGDSDEPIYIYTTAEINAGESPDPTVEYFTQDQAHSYMANLVPDKPFRKAESGETPFFREEKGYRYVGSGNGDYIFKQGDGSFTAKITYDTIYVAGGYTNNEWFKRYVLDMEEEVFNTVDDIDITVDSYTPDDTRLTADKISNYDLVVISAGFDLDPTKTLQYTSDLKAEVYNEIIKTPHVVDTGFGVHSSLAQNAYLNLVKNGKSTPSVTATNSNVAVYYFAPTALDGNTTATRLITNQFHTAIYGTTLPDNPYTVVADEIKYENMLRDKNQYLDTNISMASCFRYVINTYRIINKKTSLQVLDIQPVPRYDEQTTESNDNGPLKVSTVLSWLPTSMQDQLIKKDKNGNVVKVGNKVMHDITITHMSTAALVGKVEDITEQYDMIYIGSAKSTTDLDYLDDKLGDDKNTRGNDYHYANIGRPQNTNTLVRGLLATETFNAEDEATTRFSGNDLTPTKMKELVEFAQTRMPVVLSSDLVAIGETETTTYTMAVTLELTEDKAQIKPKITFDPPLSSSNYEIVSYQWECGEYDNLEGNHASTITPTSGNSYRCKVKVKLNTASGSTNVSATSGYYKYTAEYNSDGDFSESKDWTTSGDYTGRKNNNASSAQEGYLTVEPRRGLNSTTARSYQWHQGTRPSNASYANNPVQGATTATFDFKSNRNDPYYCVITISTRSNTYRVMSPEYTWHPPTVKLNTVNLELVGTEPPPSEVKITHFVAGSGETGVDSRKVDPSSLMYEALSYMWDNDDDINLLIDSQLTIPANSTEENPNTSKLVNALNLSRPAINMPENRQPYRYAETLSGNGSISGDCDGTLKYEFQIENITDPDPANTRYRCELYIDQNGDGRHTADELIPGITIERVTESITNGTSTSKTSKRVTNGTLQSNTDGGILKNNYTSDTTQDITYYRVSRSFNSGESDLFSGVAAWKLQVIKEGDSKVHASEKGFAYIHPSQRIAIKVLQVRSSNGEFTNNIDLSTPTTANWETQVAKNGDTYWLDTDKDGQKDNGEKNLSQFQKLYYQLYNAGMYDITVESTTIATLNAMSTRADIFKYLNDNYNMIILGFQDCYGNLDVHAANAVVDYIDTGKSLLFTHDTTSYWNNPTYIDESDSRPGWGFWFNQVIRDKVGLDRYGVTNPTYGKVATASSTTYGLVASGNDGVINSDTAEALKKKGYTVAYIPGTDHSSAFETQGYTNTTIEINPAGRADGNITTKTVSQVNQGQITEYPYTLGKTLTVKDTHQQYYQLNMNAADVVVWYCLGGTNYADEKNDATNAYYIYNRGNITYSGAGHYDGLSDDEAKLFVNTMISAYRASSGAAGVSFRTAADDEASVMLFPVQTHIKEIKNDNGVVTERRKVTESLNGDQTTYFKITNSNLKTDNTTLAVDLYYEVPSSTTGAVSATSLGIKVSNDTAVNDALFLKKVSMGSIYRADDETTPATRTNLSSDVLYKTTVPADVLKYVASLANQDSTAEKDGKLYIVATTTIKVDETTTNTYKSFDVLTLKRLGLLRLE